MAVVFPAGLALEDLRRGHKRANFSSGQELVDAWLHTQALQSQTKRLTVSRVLATRDGVVAGYYTLAMGQVDFGELPADLVAKLPRRALPVAVLAWLGVDAAYQGQGLGARLLAQALSDCHAAGETFPFVAVVLDAVDAASKSFYAHWDVREVPGRPMKLYLTTASLNALMAG